MALRIAGKQPQKPTPEEPIEAPVEELSEEVPKDIPDEGSEPTGGTLDPAVAGYRDPEAGPFKCSNCEYFEPPNACHHVSGYVDPEAICNLFNPREKKLEPPMSAEPEGPIDEY